MVTVYEKYDLTTPYKDKPVLKIVAEHPPLSSPPRR